MSEWDVNTNLTSGKYVLNSNVSNLFLQLEPVDFTNVATIYTVNCPQLNLSNYSSVNVTATGTNNAGVILGFLLDDGSAVTVANMTDPATLDAQVFDLTPYAGRTLRGEGFMTIMSLNGTQASVNITEIAFESPNLNSTSRLPIVKYSSGISRVDLQVVGIFDSNHPGIGSQYSGAVFKLEHLQEWISLQDPKHETDIVSAFLVAYKGDHFVQEIDKDYLKNKVDSLKASIPQEVDPKTGISKEIYQVSSARLDFFGLAEFFIYINEHHVNRSWLSYHVNGCFTHY